MSEVPLYRGTSLMTRRLVLEPYNRSVLRALFWSEGGEGGFISARYLWTFYTQNLTAMECISRAWNPQNWLECGSCLGSVV